MHLYPTLYTYTTANCIVNLHALSAHYNCGSVVGCTM